LIDLERLRADALDGLRASPSDTLALLERLERIDNALMRNIGYHAKAAQADALDVDNLRLRHELALYRHIRELAWFQDYAAFAYGFARGTDIEDLERAMRAEIPTSGASHALYDRRP